VNGEPQEATRWAHWALKREVGEDGVEGRSLQGIVWDEFWVSCRTL